jgi:hypothetical protein
MERAIISSAELGVVPAKGVLRLVSKLRAEPVRSARTGTREPLATRTANLVEGSEGLSNSV